MSREIKFRAWDKYVEKLTLTELGSKANLMQYTGLKDKNGVEIYEGDIVTAQDHGSLDIGEWTGEVKMGNFNGAWCLYRTVDLSEAQDGSVTQPQGMPILNFINFGSGLVPEFEFEVIGNIYQNKELLNDQQ